MVDVDTFLTTLDVMVDAFCKAQWPAEAPTRPPASLARREVVPRTVFGPGARFRGERAFDRFAARRRRDAFPALPDRRQFNRPERRHGPAPAAFFVYLGDARGARAVACENRDGVGGAPRNAPRRGSGGRAGPADIGRCHRRGGYAGRPVLTAATRAGIRTGFGFAPARTQDQPLAETFCAARRSPAPRRPTGGPPARGVDVADNGVAGEAAPARGAARSGATGIGPPGHVRRHPGPPEGRRWPARLRQTGETAPGLLLRVFRREAERPRALDGFPARLTAKCALDNFCIWLNRRLGRPNLAFADLIDW